jgi:hypothetical protein
MVSLREITVRRVAFFIAVGLLFLLGPSARVSAQAVSVPGTLAFGSEVLGTSRSQKLTLQNTGTNPLIVYSITASGDYSPTTNCVTTISAGTSCSVTVTFAASALGPRPGSLSISDNAINTPQSVTLTGAGIASVQISPASLAFGNQTVEITSSPRTLTLTNHQSVSLTISSVSVTGDFALINNCPGTVLTMGSCPISITFTPTATGIRTGTVSIVDNATGSPQTATVTGTGVAAPAVQLSPTSLSFASQIINTTSPAQNVNLTNNSSVALSISNIAASAGFAETSMCGGSVIASGSCTISVTFTPTASGTQAGTLTVTDNVKGSPQTVTLSGVGATGIAISPRQISLTLGQKLQFQSVLSGGLSGAVNWAVDGVPGGTNNSGTISSSGFYTAPQTIGQHTIQATLASDSSQTISAQAYVTNLSNGGIFTQRYDNTRVGVNAQETVLAPANVNQNQFGKLFSLPVDGQVYSQPLYMQDLSIPGLGVHNVVFVATEHDSVYAFDADTQSAPPLWQVSFINPSAGVTTVPYQDLGAVDIEPEIGITSTPVIDSIGGTIFVTAKTKELQVPSCTSSCTYNYFYHLHALDITTGAEKFGGPMLVSASVPSIGVGSVNGVITFAAFRQLQRPGLLLLNGVVYVGFGSLGDKDPYHGWLMAYDAANLQQIAVFNVTPNGNRGSIWQGGGGIAADADGYLYVVTANGTFDANTGGTDYSDSVLKLQLLSGLFQVVDYFTPANQLTMAEEDLDLGSDPPLILPDQSGSVTHLLVTAGKDARLWVLNRDDLGHLQPNDGGAVQVTQFNGSFLAGGTYWNGSLFYQATTTYLRQFTLQDGSVASFASSSFHGGYPPAPPIVSANGSINAVLWAVQATAFGTGGPAVLYAFDPTNVATEFYASTQALNSRDQAGPAVKFVVPTVANGKVYLGVAGEVDVYGLLP